MITKEKQNLATVSTCALCCLWGVFLKSQTKFQSQVWHDWAGKLQNNLILFNEKGFKHLKIDQIQNHRCQSLILNVMIRAFVFVFDFVFVFVFDFVLENIFCLMKKNDKYCLSD